jgi:hypothetical protein
MLQSSTYMARQRNTVRHTELSPGPSINAYMQIITVAAAHNSNAQHFAAARTNKEGSTCHHAGSLSHP